MQKNYLNISYRYSKNKLYEQNIWANQIQSMRLLTNKNKKLTLLDFRAFNSIGS